MDPIAKEKGSAQNQTEMEHKDSPSPVDFDVFLPWACRQLQLWATLVINKMFQQEYVSVSTMSDKNKHKKQKTKQQSRMEHDSEPDQDDVSFIASSYLRGNMVNIVALYDANDNLVQLRFEKNRTIPRIIFTVIGLIIQFHIHLTSIVIDRGLDKYIIYEIYKLLPFSHITDLCLDNTVLKEANYYLLLEKPNLIRHLSLARCRINDDVFKTLAEMLVYPLPSSTSLSILNLSSNQISDKGAKYIAEALRSNRQLSYLNLADNMLSDDGAADIFQTLINFSLSFTELLASSSRRMAYLKEKSNLTLQIAKELRTQEFEKRVKRKSSRPSPVSSKKPKTPEKVPSLKSLPENKSFQEMDKMFLDKCMLMAETTLGEFRDPFSRNNTYIESGVVYCNGNNGLCYLNLSYNHLSFLSLKKLQDVLSYQRKADMKPRGLVNVSIEGNPLPYCMELSNIDDMIDLELAHYQRRPSGRKRTQSKFVK